MRLSDFLRSDFVVPDLQGRDVESVVEELSFCAAQAGIASQEVIAGKLFERERSHPTAIGAGLAIPHATVPGMSASAIGVALASSPGTCGSADDGRGAGLLCAPVASGQ
jgi:mannitol/fructose-specific phosphotransferase system IIA component (Ntr-type)